MLFLVQISIQMHTAGRFRHVMTQDSFYLTVMTSFVTSHSICWCPQAIGSIADHDGIYGGSSFPDDSLFEVPVLEIELSKRQVATAQLLESTKNF